MQTAGQCVLSQAVMSDPHVTIEYFHFQMVQMVLITKKCHLLSLAYFPPSFISVQFLPNHTCNPGITSYNC